MYIVTTQQYSKSYMIFYTLANLEDLGFARAPCKNLIDSRTHVLFVRKLKFYRRIDQINDFHRTLIFKYEHSCKVL